MLQNHLDILSQFDAVLTNLLSVLFDEGVMYGITYKIKDLDPSWRSSRWTQCKNMEGQQSSLVDTQNGMKKDEIQKGKNRIFLIIYTVIMGVMDVIQINGSKLYSRQGNRLTFV